MNKNLSILLNVVLVLAVGFLYYFDFSGKKTEAMAAKLNSSYLTSDSDGFRPLLAYIELDSLNANITYLKEKRKELDTEMKAIDAEQENGYRNLQSQKDNFLKKGAAITEEEAQAFQGKLIDQQQQIDTKKQSLNQKLNEKSFAIMEDFQRQLREFLTEYNKDKKFMYILTTGAGLRDMAYKDPALNITSDVIKGMNEKMKPPSKQ